MKIFNDDEVKFDKEDVIVMVACIAAAVFAFLVIVLP